MLAADLKGKLGRLMKFEESFWSERKKKKGEKENLGEKLTQFLFLFLSTTM